jgi:putative chitinase
VTKLERIRSVMTRAPIEWLLPLLAEMPRRAIDMKNEEASFLAMVATESRELTVLEERLGYSSGRLVAVWPTRFYVGVPYNGKRDANEYAMNGEKLAEFVYGGRMGNRPEGSGDGWKYRGRGPVQLTGSKNYLAAQEATGHYVHDAPDLMLQPAIGAAVSCWYWSANGMDALDDDEDIRAETRRLNGGLTGLGEREAYFHRFLAVL